MQFLRIVFMGFAVFLTPVILIACEQESPLEETAEDIEEGAEEISDEIDDSIDN